MAAMTGNERSCKMDEIKWTLDAEIALFCAMRGHKPVGINKHFQMVFILEKLRKSLKKNIPSKAVWQHLETMYDLQALDALQKLPFPNNKKEFTLPESEYGTMMLEKLNHKKSDIKRNKKAKHITRKSKDRKENKKEEMKRVNQLKRRNSDIGGSHSLKFREIKNTKEKKEKKGKKSLSFSADSVKRERSRWRAELKTDKQGDKQSTGGSVKPDHTTSNAVRRTSNRGLCKK